MSSEVVASATLDAALPRQELPAAQPVATLESDVDPVVTIGPAIMVASAPEMSSVAPVPSESPDPGADSLGPSQLDSLPDISSAAFRDHGPRRAWVAVGVLACAGLAWLVVSARTSEPDTTAELAHARPKAAALPAPAPPASVTAPSSGETAGLPVTSSMPSSVTDSSKTAPAETPDMTRVAVHIWPSDAAIFESGRRLGSGVVTVDVAPGAKVTLLARKPGYRARTLVLDGSKTSINIALSRAQAESAPKDEPAPTGDAPADSSSAPESASKDPPAAAGTTGPDPLGDTRRIEGPTSD